VDIRARVCTHWHQAAGLRRSMVSPFANLESDPETSAGTASRIQGQHTRNDIILIHLSSSGQNDCPGDGQNILQKCV